MVKITITASDLSPLSWREIEVVREWLEDVYDIHDVEVKQEQVETQKEGV